MSKDDICYGLFLFSVFSVIFSWFGCIIYFGNINKRNGDFEYFKDSVPKIMTAQTLKNPFLYNATISMTQDYYFYYMTVISNNKFAMYNLTISIDKNHCDEMLK